MELEKNSIAEYKKEIASILTEMNHQLELLGKALAVSSSPEFPEGKELIIKIKADEDDVSTIREKIHTITQADQRVKTAKEEITKIEQRLASLDYEKNNLYSRIGVIAYEEYTAGGLGEEFSLLFTSVNHQNSELMKAQKALKENELRFVAASFLEKMSLRLKKNRIKSDIQKLDSAREELFRKAGKQICATELIRQVKSKNAAIIFDDFKRLELENNSLLDQMNVRKNDCVLYEDLIANSGVTGAIEKHLDEQNKRLQDKEQALFGLYRAFGKMVREHNELIEQYAQDSGVISTLQSISDLEKEESTLEKHIAELEILIKIEELELLISDEQSKIRHFNGQIESLTRQIKEVESKIAQNRKQIITLKKSIHAEEAET